ncbi:SEC-C domain-containing protein [Gracilibacillus sp. D59]|uniref:SEC-C domain-containing protein n=1 Tax=Gracilibacillus sp. D59 TaxID=3457434 RepID=UPI003FCE8295
MFTKKQIEEIKLKPYEPCPCGSDKKFKFCCYQKAREARDTKKQLDYPDGRINHILHQSLENSDFKICMGFDSEKCKPLIKSAHSIQNNRILNRISVDGHVYKIGEKVMNQELTPIFEKMSKNKASTFFGFCDYHDNELFKPIEQKDYINEPLQNFLFAFRALSLEYHKKQRALNYFRENFKQYPEGMLEVEGINLYRIAILDVMDYSKDYNLFKKDYYNDNFSNLRTIHRTLDYEVNFATSSAFSVKVDLEGNHLNDVYFNKDEEKMPSVFINIYPLKDQTNIILSYHLSDDKIYKDYFDQVEQLSEEELVKYLNFLIIEYTENVFFSPELIDNLTEREKESILKSFISSTDLGEKINLTAKDNYYKFNIFSVNSN